MFNGAVTSVTVAGDIADNNPVDASLVYWDIVLVPELATYTLLPSGEIDIPWHPVPAAIKLVIMQITIQ